MPEGRRRGAIPPIGGFDGLRRANGESSLEDACMERTDGDGRENARTQLSILYEKAPAMLHCIDESGRLLSVNARWLETMGYAASEVLGRPLGDFFTENSRVELEAALPLFFREEPISDMPYQLVTKNGHVVDILLTAIGEFDASGRFVRSLAVIEDITENLRTEQALCASEELFRVAFESANEGLCIVDVSGRFLRVNEALCRFFGHEAQTLLGMSINDMALDDDQPVSPRKITLALAGVKEHFRFERRYRHASGREIWGQVSARLMRDASGEPQYFIAHVLDMTVARWNAVQLRLHADTLEALLRLSRMREAPIEELGAFALARAAALTGSKDGFVVVRDQETDGFRLIAHDPDALAICGMEMPPETFALPTAGSWAEAHRTGRPFVVNDYQAPHPGKKGLPPGHRPLRRFLVVPVLEGGESQMLVAVANKPEDYDDADVHRLALLGEGVLAHVKDRRRQEDLERARRHAEAASQAKSGFLANMSHEIRTPLSGIIGLTQMTLSLGPRPELRENLEMILDSSRSLLGIVNDILDFSKIEAGKMEFLPVDFELREALDRTMKPFQFAARQKGLKLAVRIAPKVPDVLHGDPERLMQVVRNLVGNALKFTDQGAVTVEFRLLRPGDPMLVECAVHDTGIGIPEDRQHELFQVFTQLEVARTKRFGGTGLGLAISRRLVEMMGGTISVASRPGQGSVFAFTVSLRPAEGEPQDAGRSNSVPSQGGLAGLRVLLAEDNQVNRLFLKHFLIEAGCEVRLAGSGGEALAVLAQGPVDLVLMDIQMPEMDGTEATRRIRAGEAGESVRGIPVVALTAYSMKGDRERFLSAGLDDYVSKPVDVDELFMVMRRVLDRPEDRAGAASSAMRQQSPMDMAYYEGRGKSAFAREICRMFLDESPAVAASLERAMGEENWEAAGEAAHTLLGMAVPLRARDLTEGARRLQEAGLTGDAAGCHAACRFVQGELERVQAAIRELLA
jgi:PAS domain S-box-containing protein